MDHAHHHHHHESAGHHHHGHAAPRARALSPNASPLRASAAARLGAVAVVLAALWLAVFWAMS